jgi:hypothetical protein
MGFELVFATLLAQNPYKIAFSLPAMPENPEKHVFAVPPPHPINARPLVTEDNGFAANHAGA